MLLELIFAIGIAAGIIPLLLQALLVLNKHHRQVSEFCLKDSETAYLASTIRFELTHAKAISCPTSTTISATALDGTPIQIAYQTKKIKLKHGSGNFTDLTQYTQVLTCAFQKMTPETLKITYTLQSAAQESPSTHTLWIALKNEL